MNEQIVPDESIINKTIDLIEEQSINKKRKQKRLCYRPIVFVTMLLICIFITFPVLAANVPPFYKILYGLSPSTAQFFMPVQKSCEKNGIKMEVVATYIHKETAEIYVTMQDLAGNRIDKTTDLFDSYSIHREIDSGATCERVDYNQKTKTATFLIKLTEWRKHKIEGDKLTFLVSNFISDKHEYEKIPIGINLGTVTEAEKVKETKLSGGSGTGVEKYFESGKEAKARVITPSDVVCSPVKGIDITGIGYVDGMLHIQTSVMNNFKNDNHGYLFLKDKSGNEIKYDCYVSFIEYRESGNDDTRVIYNEYVFNIPKSEIKNYTLYGTFYTSGLYTEGPWQVTFPLVQSRNP